MNFTAKIFILIGALSTLLSIVLGTVAAHMPNENLLAAMHWFQTSMQYHQFHSLALMLVGLLAAHWPSRWFGAAGWLMIAGTLLFSGTLYQRSMLGFHDFHWLTPYGGWAYLGGWLALAVGVLRIPRR